MMQSEVFVVVESVDIGNGWKKRIAGICRTRQHAAEIIETKIKSLEEEAAFYGEVVQYDDSVQDPNVIITQDDEEYHYVYSIEVHDLEG